MGSNLSAREVFPQALTQGFLASQHLCHTGISHMHNLCYQCAVLASGTGGAKMFMQVQ